MAELKWKVEQLKSRGVGDCSNDSKRNLASGEFDILKEFQMILWRT